MTKALRILALLLVALPAMAQAPRSYSQPELDQMLAPVALYPDALLSQVLMAATYPAEVNQAAAWSRANPGLQGADAVRAVELQNWDRSVKSLIALPQILARMAENPAWTQALGDAFLGQEPHVMDTIQQLRHRAQLTGNLQSSEQMHVQQQDRVIIIQPASPQYVYVPYYDPMVVYGPWWWPAYRPVVWAPWPGYARAYRPGVSFGFWWGLPVGLSRGFFFGDFNWRQRHVHVAHAHRHHRGFAAAPATAQPQPAVQPRVGQRDNRHAERQQPRTEHGQERRDPRPQQREERRETRGQKAGQRS